MTEFLSPGDPPPHIPDDLTLPQFILDSTHECRPVRRQGATWLIEDATGRKIGLDEVTILPAVCSLSDLERLLKDSISCIWLGKRVESKMGYRYDPRFLQILILSDSQIDSGENDVGMWTQNSKSFQLACPTN